MQDIQYNEDTVSRDKDADAAMVSDDDDEMWRMPLSVEDRNVDCICHS